jgi:hypothetical protein
MFFRVIRRSLLDDDESENFPWTEFPLTYPMTNLPPLDGSHLYAIRFSTDIHPKELPDIQPSHQIGKIEIPASVEILTEHTFHTLKFFREVLFAPHSCLREIHEFQFCSSLFKIELPASIQIIDNQGFKGCMSLCKVIFFSW